METILSREGRQTIFAIGDPSGIAAARRGAEQLMQGQGFDDTVIGKVALVITEAATNLIKHAAQGDIVVRLLRAGSVMGLEILAIDSGPGMTDLALNMRDGMSTVGTWGVGLGAMQRMADEFDIYTRPGKGTAIRMVMWSAPSDVPVRKWQVGAVCLPLVGEEVSGDAWAADCIATGALLLVADGLGHGPLAAEASEAAARVVAVHPGASPALILEEAHEALRDTRGAAVAVARIDTAAKEITFAGVGNISACVQYSDERRQMISHAGIVGNNMRKLQEFVLPWPDDTALILHSDGLGTRWDLEQYPGLAARHPSLIAAVLYRDFARGRDDVCVLVVRAHPGGRS